MFKALTKKKLREFRANQVPGILPFLLVVSLLSLLRLGSDDPLVVTVSIMPMLVSIWCIGIICAAIAFSGDSTNQVNRFLEYLPLNRSAFWLANYGCGLALLCMAAVSLLLLDVLLFPLGADSISHDMRPVRTLMYLLPNGIATAVTCGSFMFWMYSVAVFPVAYLGGGNEQSNNGVIALLMMGIAFFPIAFIRFLWQLNIVPSGLAVSPILLTSAVLYSAGSYTLFALVPRHIAPVKHALLGAGLFLAISAVLFGQLYVKYHAWQVLDPSQVAQVTRVNTPHLAGERNLILADVDSYRSGGHGVLIDVEQEIYHDLGRGLTYVDVPQNNSNRLHFVYAPSEVFPSYSRTEGYFTSMSSSAQEKRSFRFPFGRFGRSEHVRALPDKRLVVYSAMAKESHEEFLCVADSSGKLLRQFEIREFLVDPAGRAVAIAPMEKTRGEEFRVWYGENPYMLIDLVSGAVQRFRLPGSVVYFAKDLSRVICSQTRIQNGRQYKSYVLVELPSLVQRVILDEDEFPPQEVTTQVDSTIHPNVAIDDDAPTTLLRVNNAFDIALWRRQRVEGDHFLYSIVQVDLTTGQQQVVIPESATPKMPVVIVKEAQETVLMIHRFTADGTAFSYSIGPQTYLYNMQERQSVLLADNSIVMDESHEEGATFFDNYSPSGRRVLRYDNVWHERTDDRPRARLKFSAVEIFENGKPVRVYTGKRPIAGVMWLDNKRIIFHEEAAIYMLDAAAGLPVQVFPPKGRRS